LSVAISAIILAAAARGLAEPPENGVRGVVTEVVLVEEDPSERSGSAKGEFAVTGRTEILEQRGGDPASFEDLRVGQMVEATYEGPVAESYPTQGIAGRIIILDGDRTGNDGGSAVLPDTGGAPLLVPGALLIAGGLLAR
jgi:hypothetical protein